MGQSASLILATPLWARSCRESSNIMRTEEINDHSTLWCVQREAEAKIRLTTQHPHQSLHRQRRISFRPIVT
jgi:hypothetical protein